MLAVKASSSANKTINKTFYIYLSLIPSKVTDLITIYEYMLYLQSVTTKVNIRYRKITLMWEQQQTHLKCFLKILKCSHSSWELSLHERKLQGNF